MPPGTSVRDTATSLASPCAPPAPVTPAARQHPWWRRARVRIGAREAPAELRSVRLECLLALLADARAQLDAGWVQGGWWSIATGSPAGDERLVLDGFAAATTPPDSIRGACLVGALVRAGRRQTPGRDSELATAVDVVYDAFWEPTRRPGAEPVIGLPALSAPVVRLARVQALTRWNDHQERTQAEVIGVVDRAIARIVQSIVSLPAAPVPVREPAVPDL